MKTSITVCQEGMVWVQNRCDLELLENVWSRVAPGVIAHWLTQFGECSSVFGPSSHLWKRKYSNAWEVHFVPLWWRPPTGIYFLNICLFHKWERKTYSNHVARKPLYPLLQSCTWIPWLWWTQQPLPQLPNNIIPKVNQA